MASHPQVRWIIYGDILSRHVVDSLVAALRRADVEVIEVPAVERKHRFEPDSETEAQSRRRIEAALPADVLFNFRPEELTPAQVRDLSAAGVKPVVWFADDPLNYKVCYRHVVEAYDLTLHTGREDVLAFYEDQHGALGYSFPFWSDDEHFPYAYDPDGADIEVGFLGNCSGRRRKGRYEFLADLPWHTRFFGRPPRYRGDYLGIQEGVLERHEIPAALRRFRVAINLSQQFRGVKDGYVYPELASFGDYYFPSRLVAYAAVGIPTVSLALAGSEAPFPAVRMADDREGLVAAIRAWLADRHSLLEASREMRRDFDLYLTADSRVAMLRSLLEQGTGHDRTTRANLWRSFGNANRSDVPATELGHA